MAEAGEERLAPLSTAAERAKNEWSAAEAEYDKAIAELRSAELKNVAARIFFATHARQGGKWIKVADTSDVMGSSTIRKLIQSATKYECERRAARAVSSQSGESETEILNDAQRKAETEIEMTVDAWVRDRKYPKEDHAAHEIGLKRTKLRNADKALEDAKRKYRYLDPSTFDYEMDPSRESQMSTDEPEAMEPLSHVMISIDEVPQGVWIQWPKQVTSIKYGSRRAKEESGGESADIAATGPGEERLARIFGGRVQGGSTSYDVVTPGRPVGRWEVKALEKPADTIRPGTEGVAAYEKARMKIERIMKQIQQFVEISEEFELDVTFSGDGTPEGRTIVSVLSACRNFIDAHYEMIVSKGEIAADRFLKLQKIINMLSRLISFVREETGKSTTDKLTVVIAGREIVVDKATYIDVLRRLEKSPGAEDLLKSVSALEIASAELRDTAFDEPEAFEKQWKSMVRASDVFRQVDGVFIVNYEKGFQAVPKEMFDEVFRFAAVSQGKPKFSFSLFDAPSVPIEQIREEGPPKGTSKNVEQRRDVADSFDRLEMWRRRGSSRTLING